MLPMCFMGASNCVPLIRRWLSAARVGAMAFAGTAVGVSVVAGAADHPAAEEACASLPRETVKIAEVVDGTTLRLDGGRLLRLAGIEDPVAASPAANGRDALLAERVRSWIVQPSPASIAMVRAGPDDRYGRLHAVLFDAGGHSLQTVLLGEGLVRVHILPGENGCLVKLLDEEQAARERTLGIWTSAEFAPRNASDPSLRQEIGLYELVEGRVDSVGVGKQAVFLNFGRRLRGDFTVIIAKQVAARLAEAGWLVDKLKARKVRVRGVIEESDGPAIRIFDPAHIELLGE